MTKKMNWDAIAYNIEDAKESLDKLYAGITPRKSPGEEEFQIALQHIYHHLNFAWNCRHVSTERQARMTRKDFKKWGKYPKDVEKL